MSKARKPASRKPRRKPPGPQPDRLVIEGDWKDAVKTALRKPNPRPPTKRKATP
jgi:hypothetical protein